MARTLKDIKVRDGPRSCYIMADTHRHVLFVDDYPDALAVWSIFLRMSGYDVTVTGDGLKAVDLAHTTHPDIVILDLDLPGLTGCEVARHLRDDDDTSGIPLIAVTGHSEAAYVADARDAGFDAILTKPCEPGDLLRNIERLLPAASGAGKE